MSTSATSTSRRSSFGRSNDTQLWTSFSEKLHVHIGPNSITWDEDISVWRQDIDDDLTILDDMFSDDSADFHTPLASLEDQEYRDRIGFVFRGLLSARTLLQVDCPLDPDLKKIIHNEKQYDWTNPAARKAMIDRTMIYTHWLIYMDKIQEDLSECTDCTERRSIEVDLVENQRYAICCSALQESKQIFREYKDLLKGTSYREDHEKWQRRSFTSASLIRYKREASAPVSAENVGQDQPGVSPEDSAPDGEV